MLGDGRLKWALRPEDQTEIDRDGNVTVTILMRIACVPPAPPHFPNIFQPFPTPPQFSQPNVSFCCLMPIFCIRFLALLPFGFRLAFFAFFLFFFFWVLSSRLPSSPHGIAFLLAAFVVRWTHLLEAFAVHKWPWPTTINATAKTATKKKKKEILLQLQPAELQQKQYKSNESCLCNFFY